MALRSKKQKLFVQEYLIDLNATQAAARAGYKDPNFGRQLLTKTNVSTEIQKALKARSKRTEVTQDRVLKEYARLAFVDPRKFFDENDNLKAISTLDDDTAACVAGMDINTKMVKNKDGDIEPETIKKIKITDKKGALDSLARHLGMFEKDKSGATTVIINADYGSKNNKD